MSAQITETTKQGRREIRDRIVKLGETYRIIVIPTEQSRDISISFLDEKTKLQGLVTLRGKSVQRKPNTFVVCWVLFGRPGWRISDRFVPFGAVNQSHHLKATDVCHSAEELLILLEDRFQSISEGRAVERTEEPSCPKS